MSAEETYIGDGVYASVEGGHVKIRTPRSEGDHIIFLEPDVCLYLIRFIKRSFNFKPEVLERLLKS